MSAKEFNWYEEDFVSFLMSRDLPKYQKDDTIKNILSKEKERFVRDFSESIKKDQNRSFSKAFYTKLSEQTEHIKDSFILLCDIVDSFDNANLADAQNKFDKLMDDLKGHLMTEDISGVIYSSEFFRVRPDNGEKLSERKDLFHIPYKKRYLASNERYSLAGQPSLYIATDLEIAWRECGCPHRYYYSKFKYIVSKGDVNEWEFILFMKPRIFAMRFSAKNENEEYYLRQAIDYLIVYPLIFACSIVNPNGNSPFKQEFMIPQMLMQWIFRNDSSAIKGIKYFPCGEKNNIHECDGYNIAMPAKISDHRRQYSEILVEKFEVTEPKKVEIQFEKNEMKAVSEYKESLLNFYGKIVAANHDCYCVMYDIVDAFDRILQNIETTDIQLAISMIRNIVTWGNIALEKYKKESIIIEAEKPINYTHTTEERISSFLQLYDEFKPQVITIAEQFLRKLEFEGHFGMDDYDKIKV